MQIAGLVEARVRLVLRREARRAALEEGGDADAAQFPFALRSFAPRGKTLPVGKLQGLVHHALEFAAVVSRAVRRPVGHGLGRNEILPAQRDRVEAVLGGGVIHQPLDRAGDVGPPGDRKSTRLNSSHMSISYAVFCLKKKKITKINIIIKKNNRTNQ